MRALEWILWLVAINGILLLVTTAHLRKDSKWIGRTLSSMGVFFIAVAVVSVSGWHKCDEGSAPPFVIYSSASIGAILPWLYPLKPWLIRGLIALTVTAGMFTASYLASSYHSDSITGNPVYASDRFWHTAFTGQYPRDHAKMAAYRQEWLRAREEPESENSEQAEAQNPSTDALE